MDSAIVRSLYHWASDHAAAGDLVKAIAQYGIYLLVIALALVWAWPGTTLQARRRAVVACGLSLVAAALLSVVLGTFIDRPRPFAALQLTPLFSHSADSSFPSDHALLGVGLIAPLVWALPRLGAPLLVWALLVGFARVAAAVHYPSDIAGSALIALALGLASLPVAKACIARLPAGLARWTGLRKKAG